MVPIRAHSKKGYTVTTIPQFSRFGKGFFRKFTAEIRFFKKFLPSASVFLGFGENIRFTFWKIFGIMNLYAH